MSLEKMYESFFTIALDMACIATTDGYFQRLNPAWTTTLGWTSEELMAKPFLSFVHPDDLAPTLKEIERQKNGHIVISFVNRYRTKNGEYRWLEWNSTHAVDGILFAIARDITENVETEERLKKSEAKLLKQAIELKALSEKMEHLANYDNLTGLPNLRLCNERLDMALATQRRKKSQTAIFFIDLDGFKEVNDTKGHAVGDMVLKGVAERLKASLREGDTVGRIGGDEFLVLLPNSGTKDEIAKIAIKIIDVISKPFSIDKEDMCIGASIGIAISPTDGTKASELLVHADKTMYDIKNCGKNNYAFYS
ncbi:sensor domain-containing diguanylate cyclase [Shewanella aestuarii]|uniref:Diguanylate cyclase n=1 Tax=Shewanella aestuarii TaxID=1028752 RepID=A0A6G9QLQ7_9GAMM|nr:sensor domain-containing diguanylate cyclase [Shewanella aestuarii]QIR14977.1 diguanylate cyclase [Shewanella aestuarii]